jgi:toxin FitB
VNYLLDTTVVAEWIKPQPDRGLMMWTHGVDEDRCYLSVVTFGELRKSTERLRPSRKRQRLLGWLAIELRVRFERRILPVDVDIAEAWGRMAARGDVPGQGIGDGDALIAATAEVHGLQLVTSDAQRFEMTGIDVFDPWLD